MMHLAETTVNYSLIPPDIIKIRINDTSFIFTTLLVATYYDH